MLSSVIPFTLQTPAVLLAGAFLGSTWGAVSQLVYLAAGALGLPVFAKPPHGGLDYFTGPTAGYLFAFPLAAFVVGLLLRRRAADDGDPQRVGVLMAAVAFASGMLVIFTSGAIGLWLSGMPWADALDQGVASLQVLSGVKLLLTLGIYLGWTRWSARRRTMR